MLADFVYEGARSITGPLASRGAIAFVVGVWSPDSTRPQR